MELTTPPSAERIDHDIRTGRSWARACLGGCVVFMIVALIGGVMIWRIVGGISSLPQSLRGMPTNFPSGIQVHAIETAESIVYFSSPQKSKAVAALFAPVRFLSHVIPGVELKMGIATSSVDTVTMTWTDLQETRAQLFEVYTRQFGGSGYAIAESSDQPGVSSLTMERNGVRLRVDVQDLPETQALDTVVLRIDYPNH